MQRWIQRADLVARARSIRWVRVNPQGQGHGAAFTTRSGAPRAWSTGSGSCAWCGPNRWGRTPGRKSQISARAPGRRTRPISVRPAAGSAVVHRQGAGDQVEGSFGEGQGGHVADQERWSVLTTIPCLVGVGLGAGDHDRVRSRPVTSSPCWRASRIDRWPGPHPTSSTRPPSATAAMSAAMRARNGPSRNRLSLS